MWHRAVMWHITWHTAGQVVITSTKYSLFTTSGLQSNTCLTLSKFHDACLLRVMEVCLLNSKLI